jgi:DNA-binding MarR family transcriptional regulator
MLSHEQREQVIVAILQSLDAVHPRGLTAHSLMTPLRLSGLTLIERPDVESLLADLIDKGWLKRFTSDAASEVQRVTRTEEGRAYLRKNGF